jgi:hypothetical protein
MSSVSAVAVSYDDVTNSTRVPSGFYFSALGPFFTLPCSSQTLDEFEGREFLIAAFSLALVDETDEVC